MATAAQNLQTAYDNVCAALASASASPKPSYSVDGRSFSWAEYFEMLLRQQQTLLAALQANAGPFTVLGQCVAITAVDVGADYAAVVDGLTTVTVLSVDADTGDTLATSTGVTCLKRIPDGRDYGVAGDGLVGAETCSFVVVASGVSFTPKTRDQVTDADGVTWSVGRVTAESDQKLYNLQDCTRSR